MQYLKRFISILFVCLALNACATSPDHPSLKNSKLPKTIKLKKLFFNIDSNTSYKISPDGKKLAWLGKKEGIRTIFFKYLNNDKIYDIKHPIFRTLYILSNFRWAQDSQHILYVTTDEISGMGHVFAADITKYWYYSKDITPFKHYDAYIHRILRHDPEHVLVERCQSNQTITKISTVDLLKVNIINRQVEVIAENPGNVLEWLTDRNGVLVGRITIPSLGAKALEIFDTSTKTHLYHLMHSKNI